MFHCTVTDPQHLSFLLSAGSAIAGSVLGADMPRLRHCDISRRAKHSQLDRLQSVMNAAAWLVCLAWKSDHITSLSVTFAGLPLPAWYGSAIPHAWTAPCGKHGISSVTPFCFNTWAGHSTNLSSPLMSHLRSCCSSHMEWSAIWRHYITIALRLQTMAEDVTLQPFLWCLTVWHCWFLFFFVKCYQSFFDSMAL